MVDFSKYKKGNIVRVHCCDSCTIHAGYTPKYPADSGVESWPCEVCGQYGIGSMMDCKIGDWLTLLPLQPTRKNEVELKWKKDAEQYSNDETLYLVPNDETLHFGSWIVGGIRYDSFQAVEGIWYKSYSEGDEMKNEVICKLPGVVERRYFPTVSEAKVAVESAVKHWLSQLSDTPQKT